MSQRFWNLFSADYRENCLKWKHSRNNPVMPKTDTQIGFRCNWTANPDILTFKGKRYLYYRGNGILENRPGELHDRIAVAELIGTDGKGNLLYNELNDGNVIIDVGNPGEFDCHHVLDPAAIIFQDKVFLYYTAVGAFGNAVGLSISEDGEHFEKYGMVMRGRAPEVILRDGVLYMISWEPDNDGKIELYRSEDGFHFEKIGPVLGLYKKDGWDSLAITTPRVWQEDDTYYMLYGGSSYLVDEPDYFGLARSKDLLHWEQHPGNPIFGCGAKGSADGGAIWFPALFEEEDRFAMIYEGSRGKYHWDLSSQICLSTIPKNR